MVDTKYQFFSGIPILLKQGEKGSWVDIICTGKRWLEDGRGALTILDKDLNDIEKNFTADNITADYQHSSKEDHHEKAISSGWLQKLRSIDRDGVRWLQAFVEWTPRAVEYIKNKEYRFTSIEFKRNITDHFTGKNIGTKMFAFALTNRPAWLGQKPVLLCFKADSQSKEDESMKLTSEKIKSLGLPADFNDLETDKQTKLHDKALDGLLKAKDDGVKLTQEISGYKDKIKTLEEKNKDVDKTDGVRLAQLEGEVDKKTETIKLMKGELATVTTELNNQKFDRFWLSYLKPAEGKPKVLPAQKEHYRKFWDHDAEACKLTLDAAPEHNVTGFAGSGDDPTENDRKEKNISEKVDKEITKLMQEEKIEDYGEAMLLMSQRKPDLMDKYNAYQAKHGKEE